MQSLKDVTPLSNPHDPHGSPQANKTAAPSQEFWKQIELPNGADETYVCIGVKASNYFMPKDTLSDKGPGQKSVAEIGPSFALELFKFLSARG